MNFKKSASIAAAVAALAAISVPAMAETSIYGSARLTTFWNTVDSKPTDLTPAKIGINNGTTADFEEALHTNSRLGVNFSNGDQTAKVEFGVSPTGFASRHIYGVQKFGFGSVLVGQTDNPYYFWSESVAKADGVNNNYGSLWDTRQPQIKLTLTNGVYVSAITPSTPAATTENYLPKLNVGYEGKAGNFAYGAGVVGQRYKQTVAAVAAVGAKNTVINATGVATTSNATTAGTVVTTPAVAYVAGQGGTVASVMGYAHGTFKADALTIAFNFGIGQNTGDMGFTNANAVATNKYVSTDYGDDTTSYEGFVQASYLVSPMLKVNAGFGYAADDNAQYVKVDNRMMAFVNTNVTLAKGFTITPEFAYFDQLDNTSMASTTTTAQTAGAYKQYASFKGDKEYLVGARWMINF